MRNIQHIAPNAPPVKPRVQEPFSTVDESNLIPFVLLKPVPRCAKSFPITTNENMQKGEIGQDETEGGKENTSTQNQENAHFSRGLFPSALSEGTPSYPLQILYSNGGDRKMVRKMGRKGENGDINIIQAEATPMHTISEITSLDNSLQFCNVQHRAEQNCLFPEKKSTILGLKNPNVPPVIAQHESRSPKTFRDHLVGKRVQSPGNEEPVPVPQDRDNERWQGICFSDLLSDLVDFLNPEDFSGEINNQNRAILDTRTHTNTQKRIPTDAFSALDRCCHSCLHGRQTNFEEPPASQGTGSLGLALHPNFNKDVMEVIGLEYGGPAERSGKVRVGDYLVQIDSTSLESILSTLDGEAAVHRLLKGEPGSTVILTFRRIEAGYSAAKHRRNPNNVITDFKVVLTRARRKDSAFTSKLFDSQSKPSCQNNDEGQSQKKKETDNQEISHPSRQNLNQPIQACRETHESNAEYLRVLVPATSLVSQTRLYLPDDSGIQTDSDSCHSLNSSLASFPECTTTPANSEKEYRENVVVKGLGFGGGNNRAAGVQPQTEVPPLWKKGGGTPRYKD